MKMHCDARVCTYSGDIEDLVKQYSGNFFEVPLGLPNVKKLGLVECIGSESYILIFSKSPENLPPGYNVTITVMGPGKERVKEIMNNIQKKIGIETQEAPEFIKNQFDFMQKLMESLFKEPTYH